MKKLYQNIQVPGTKLEYEDEKRVESKFWNEGKWNNFIDPLLPKDCKNKTLIEIGSSAGLFLKLAKDKGFANVIGIESHPARIKEAELYRESVGMDYKLINASIDHNYNFNTIPLANVVLISNTHYYSTIHNLSSVVDNLWSKCVYCIVVSAQAKTRTGYARHNIDSVRGYFRYWQELDLVDNVEMEGDPSPRKFMYGVKFKGGLQEMDTNNLYEKYIEETQLTNDRRKVLPDEITNFYKQVFSDRDCDVRKISYFDYVKKRRGYNEDSAYRLLRRKKELGYSIKENGMYVPIYIGSIGWRNITGRIVDGQHRLVIAKVLGHKSIITRMI